MVTNYIAGVRRESPRHAFTSEDNRKAAISRKNLVREIDDVLAIAPVKLRLIAAQYPKALADHPGRKHVLVARDLCALVFQIARANMCSPNRTTKLVIVRQLSMVITSTLTKAGTAAIGRAFARDHSTVVNALKRYRGFVETALQGEPS